MRALGATHVTTNQSAAIRSNPSNLLILILILILGRRPSVKPPHSFIHSFIHPKSNHGQTPPETLRCITGRSQHKHQTPSASPSTGTTTQPTRPESMSGHHEFPLRYCTHYYYYATLNFVPFPFGFFSLSFLSLSLSLSPHKRIPYIKPGTEAGMDGACAADIFPKLPHLLTYLHTRVLACWASSGYGMQGCASVEQQLRSCMDAPVRLIFLLLCIYRFD